MNTFLWIYKSFFLILFLLKKLFAWLFCLFTSFCSFSVDGFSNEISFESVSESLPVEALCKRRNAWRRHFKPRRNESAPECQREAQKEEERLISYGPQFVARLNELSVYTFEAM
jgi:hypothetical protein